MNFLIDGVNRVNGGDEDGGWSRCGFLCIVAMMCGRLAVYRLELSRRGVESKTVFESARISIVFGIDFV